MESQHIYIVFSAVPNRMGSAIRRITREPYNHVSVSLDEKFTMMYSFARRYYHTPFCGGFVHEYPDRYHIHNIPAEICVCKLPVEKAQYEDLKILLSQMEAASERYLYNHLSALFAPIHKRIATKDAYTCVEFCVNILHSAGFGVSPLKFYTVCDLQNLLQPYVVYTGSIPNGDQSDPSYFTRPPFFQTGISTFRDFVRLITRHFQKKGTPR